MDFYPSHVRRTKPNQSVLTCLKGEDVKVKKVVLIREMDSMMKEADMTRRCLAGRLKPQTVPYLYDQSCKAVYMYTYHSKLKAPVLLTSLSEVIKGRVCRVQLVRAAEQW